MDYADKTIKQILYEQNRKRKVEEVIASGLWDCLREDVKEWYKKFTKGI